MMRRRRFGFMDGLRMCGARDAPLPRTVAGERGLCFLMRLFGERRLIYSRPPPLVSDANAWVAAGDVLWVWRWLAESARLRVERLLRKAKRQCSGDAWRFGVTNVCGRLQARSPCASKSRIEPINFRRREELAVTPRAAIDRKNVAVDRSVRKSSQFAKMGRGENDSLCAQAGGAIPRREAAPTRVGR